MNMKDLLSVVLLLGALWGQAQDRPDNPFPVHPDSVEKPDVPRGRIEGPFEWKSGIYPGTVRDYWLHVPRQYDPARPACVAVIQDGLDRARGWRLPTVLDNLIHQGELPVIIGIFINPGVIPSDGEEALPRFNRSFEYDSLGDRYARFLVEEILPEVGKTHNLSPDPGDRMIGGASSGAICAFNVAWERPDAFRRVLSTIGTYVDLRGGHHLSTLVRKTEPKPIRIFLQDGSRDLDIYAGSWWMANQDLLSSLRWAGYAVHHIWGEGGHNTLHDAAIMPDVLRWLWQDHPDPILARPAPDRRTDILVEGEGWRETGSLPAPMSSPVAHPSGTIHFCIPERNEIWKCSPGEGPERFVGETAGAGALSYSGTGELLATSRDGLIAYSAEGKRRILARDFHCDDFVVRNGALYGTSREHPASILHLDGSGTQRKLPLPEVARPGWLALSPDHGQLHLTARNGIPAWSLMFRSGEVAYPEPLFRLFAGEETDAGVEDTAVDGEGRVYFATRIGIQVCDPLGRLHLIIAPPPGGRTSGLVFGGMERDILYTSANNTLYARRLNTRGHIPASGPEAPGRPRL